MKKTLIRLAHLLPMFCFVLSAAGCNAVMPDRFIDDDPEAEFGDNDYMEWSRETLAAINRDLRIEGTDSYYENQNRNQVSFIWGNIFLLYTYAEGAGLRADEWEGELSKCFLNLENHWSPDYRGIAGYCTAPLSSGTPDRYYDENGWMAIGLARAYELTGREAYLAKRARRLASPSRARTTCSAAASTSRRPSRSTSPRRTPSVRPLRFSPRCSSTN